MEADSGEGAARSGRPDHVSEQVPVRPTVRTGCAAGSWLLPQLVEDGGSTEMITGGRRYQFADLDYLIAEVENDPRGYLGYLREGNSVTIVALRALSPGQGAGRMLLDKLAAICRDAGYSSIRVTTTNDNLDALAFYQRNGFRIAAVRPGAVDQARKLKPSIPMVADNRIPIRDEIDLILPLGPPSQ